MRVFSPGWNFSPPNWAENSAPFCSQLFVKLTLRLHEKFSARAEKPARAGISALLELGGAGIFSPGKRAEISHIIANFSSPG